MSGAKNVLLKSLESSLFKTVPARLLGRINASFEKSVPLFFKSSNTLFIKLVIL
jgi:hypothetical protein